MEMIRHIRPEEKREVIAWWKERGEMPPTEEMLPEDSTFILEQNGKAKLCVTVYLTNACIAWVDNLIRNPDAKPDEKFEDSMRIIEHCKLFAKAHGKSVLFCMSAKESTDQRYRQFGFVNTAKGISTFIMGVN